MQVLQAQKNAARDRPSLAANRFTAHSSVA